MTAGFALGTARVQKKTKNGCLKLRRSCWDLPTAAVGLLELGLLCSTVENVGRGGGLEFGHEGGEGAVSALCNPEVSRNVGIWLSVQACNLHLAASVLPACSALEPVVGGLIFHQLFTKISGGSNEK